MRIPAATLSALLLCGACNIYKGGTSYSSSTAAPVVAELKVVDCELPSGVGRRKLTEMRLAMVQGTRDFSLVVVANSGDGVEIEDHWVEAGVHHFALRKGKKGWVYRLPDEQGKPGSVEYLSRVTTSASKRGVALEGRGSSKCPLTVTSVSTEEPTPPATAQGDNPQEESSSEERVCTDGDTRQCFGPGACKGGQTCREDGSGFSACDCGEDSVAEEPHPEEDSEEPETKEEQ